jgi:hypothetical protein
MATPHRFHIPVMGTGFTVDTPLKVAHLGITSVISLVDDELIEQMRCAHCRLLGEPYERISRRAHDSRARRITAYLDLIDRNVARRIAEMKRGDFAVGSDLSRYYELLPESPLKEGYRRMRATEDANERAELERALRDAVTPGEIEVNIMVKLDREAPRRAERALGGSDALAALRGYALSTVTGSMVFSAGMNQRLFSYLGQFEGFFPDAEGNLKKKVTLKVSDYRSGEIQSRLLAKNGIWVSEFRIESGLNCGGHAFVGSGQLLGSILEQFRAKRVALRAQLFESYTAALRRLGRVVPSAPPDVLVTVQGGIGTAAEQRLLLEHYGADRTGWGSPFLLVPEVTNVDAETLQRLLAARPEDIVLSPSSPLGVPFWNLMTSPSEEARRLRIAEGRPGSPCLKGHLSLSSELSGTPLCVASRAYQMRKLAQLESAGMLDAKRREAVLSKSCICHDLSGGAANRLGFARQATSAICPGPNIVYFKATATLEEMAGHIYGKNDLLAGVQRPHMFVVELRLAIDELERRMRSDPQAAAWAHKYAAQLLLSIEHCRQLPATVLGVNRAEFVDQLEDGVRRIRRVLAASEAKSGTLEAPVAEECAL